MGEGDVFVGAGEDEGGVREVGWVFGEEGVGCSNLDMCGGGLEKAGEGGSNGCSVVMNGWVDGWLLSRFGALRYVLRLSYGSADYLSYSRIWGWKLCLFVLVELSVLWLARKR